MFADIRQWLGRHRERSKAADQEIGLWRLQALFNNFKRILLLNNAVLEEMAKMERAQGGEYIFDRNFLETEVSIIASKVHHIAYNLNALTGNHHIQLYDRYQELRTLLDDILSNNIRALTSEAALPLNIVGWEHEALVGMDLVCLAELFYYPWIAPVDGFAVTHDGMRVLKTEQEQGKVTSRWRSEVRAAIADNLHHLLEEQPCVPITVVVTRIEDEEEPLEEVGSFQIRVDYVHRQSSVVRLNEWGVELEVMERVMLAEIQPDESSSREWQYGDVDLMLHSLEQIVQSLEEPKAVAGKPCHYALFLHPQPPCVLSGTVHTRPCAYNPFGARDGLVINAVSTEDDSEDFYLLGRTHPFVLMQSRLATRPAGYRFADQQQATDISRENKRLWRGSALLEPGLLASLAETSMLLERLFGAPVAISWQIWEDGVCRITKLRPLRSVDDPKAAEDFDELIDAPVLCEGGQTGQTGVGAGPVVHIDETTDPGTFPPGAVAVASIASPNLTPILQRAAALVTEFGSAAGHLATVTRELRLPSIFGLPNALTLLPPDTEVTVDAGEITVYAGIIEAMLRYNALSMEFTPQDPEYRMLRRLLRFIQPLSLVDPQSQEFSAANCRSFHDIIHFCHEKAVDELAHFQERRPGLGHLRTRMMDLGLPMDIRVLDIGGGTTPDVVTDMLKVADIRSVPFGAFLDGLVDPRAWNTQAPSLGMRDIISSMPGSIGLLNASADTLGANLAIIGREYLNLSLRLGYHFSVIDAYMGEDVSRNYVYFRFVGGLADPERRGRRARFIGRVLATMEFKAEVKGDLVIARLKMMESPVLHTALVVLGALTSYTRQQDTNMRSEAELEAMYTEFIGHFLPAFSAPSQENPETGEPEEDTHAPH